MTSCIPTIASVKNCVHDGVLRCKCHICSYFNGLQKTSNHGRRCLTLLAEEKQRQHLDILAKRLHSMCDCRELSEGTCYESSSSAVTGRKLHKLMTDADAIAAI